MSYQASDTLQSRTFIGLLVAQFLAAFNDQAIHASAMFYAINTKALTEAQAISLMPILFYAPWAIFCTVAGYLADRYSKRQALVFWKMSEVVITLVALAGFWLGSGPLGSPFGPFIVLSTVFFMGTHSAFFVPAKYGVMPEILQPHLLSRGNGLLESLSFLAIILGTVCGGMLSFYFRRQEYFIGIILFTLAIIGAVASLMIHKMPAANPTRTFPKYIYKPLWDNIRTLFRTHSLALTVLGIAFFTFVVAFMRATVYMLGESQVPRWSEFKTSVIVGMSALGIGLGSPLAGYLSGGKVELGLVPIGAMGMILATILAAFTLHWLPGLIAGIICIGFFTGFFIVPLFTLLQYRAPKTSKGEMIATSNFINVTGAIAASVLFYLVVFATHQLGVAPRIEPVDRYAGVLLSLDYNRHGRPAFFELRTSQGVITVDTRRRDAEPEEDALPAARRVALEDDLIDVLSGIGPGSEVKVSTYTLPATKHRPYDVVTYQVRSADAPLTSAYDNEELPPYLFIGAGLMTLLTLIVLCRHLPDMLLRALVWLRALGRYRLQVIGSHNLPTEGALLVGTNGRTLDECLQVAAATDRYTRLVLPENVLAGEAPWTRLLARRGGVLILPTGVTSGPVWDHALAKAEQTLERGFLVGLPLVDNPASVQLEQFFRALLARRPVPLEPVFCHDSTPSPVRRLRVVLGHPLAAGNEEQLRQAVQALKDWVRRTEKRGMVPTTVLIPKVLDASPTEPVASPPATP
ncbi:MAG: MFS transporter [Gemmataceae bacterium]